MNIFFLANIETFYNPKRVCSQWNNFFSFDKITKLTLNTTGFFKKLNNNKIIEFLEKLENLKYLDCSSTNISEIPESLNCLEELNCHLCQNLIKIPKNKTLKKLNCIYTNISEIPETLNYLEELICHDCKYLTKIPKIKTLKKLDCSCTNISEIYADLDCLEDLNCSYCKNLNLNPIYKIKNINI